MLLFDDGDVVIHGGDCLTILPQWPDESVDAVVTDPPYGIDMLGREWDVRAGFQDWCQRWAAECLRLLKPGGLLVAFGHPRTYHRLTCGIEDAGFEIRDGGCWLYSGIPKGRNLSGEHKGRGTALRPGHEPFALARKPFAGSVDQCVAEYGTGAYYIDAARFGPPPPSVPQPKFAKNGRAGFGASDGRSGEMSQSDKGRWPSNLALDEGAAEWLGDEARYFYCAKADEAERDEGGVRNDHPTVKPLALMRWLVRLTAPPGGLVLDPFLGSGTTARAARAEGLRCWGVEEDATHAPVIRARLGQLTLL